MSAFPRRIGASLSKEARRRMTALRPYPTLDMWRNPVTRGIARKLANESHRRSLDEIDFEYRVTETNVSGVPCALYETEGAAEGRPIIIYVHGGDFVSGDPVSCAASVLPICHLAGSEGLGVGYTLLPDAGFPTQINELDAVFRNVIADFPEDRFWIVAESTGAAIALAAMMRWRDENGPMPDGAVFLSPFIDASGASDSHIALAGRDPLMHSYGGGYARSLFRFYAPDYDPHDPAVSPIHGNFEGLPQMLIQAGARSVLIGDAARLAQRARNAGVRAQLHVYDGMFHRFHSCWSIPETKTAHEEAAAFITGWNR